MKIIVINNILSVTFLNLIEKEHQLDIINGLRDFTLEIENMYAVEHMGDKIGQGMRPADVFGELEDIE